MNSRLRLALAAITLPAVVSLSACSSGTATVTESAAAPSAATSSATSQASSSSSSASKSESASSSTGASSTATATETASTLPENFEASGTEPFWAVKVTGTKAVYSTPENQAGTAFTGTRKGMSLASEGFSITLDKKKCSDGMSDIEYEYTATVDVQDKQLNGCAKAS